MQAYFILTVLGEDRPGLVKTLSDSLAHHQGNWMESRLVHLANKFAGVVQVALPDTQSASFQQAISVMQRDGWQIQIEQDKQDKQSNAARQMQAQDHHALNLEILGPDHPGIIHNVTEKLASLNVNIEELISEQRAAPMSNEKLFFARLTLSLPSVLSEDAVQDALEDLSDQLMIDVQLTPDDAEH